MRQAEALFRSFRRTYGLSEYRSRQAVQHCRGRSASSGSAGGSPPDYRFASGAVSTALQAGGSAAIVIGGFGFGGTLGGFGCSTASLNQ